MVAGILAAAAGFAQAAPKLEFEVSSVRPSQISNRQNVGVGVHLDGSQVRIAGMDLRRLVAMAYRLKDYQVSAPAWMHSTFFDISGKLPEGTTSDQIPEMLQALLEKDFQIKYHRDKKDFPVYLLEQGKPPLKMTKSAEDEAADGKAPAVNIAGSGSAAGVSVDLGRGSYYTFANNKFDIKKVTMDTLATLLERYVDRPILNQTGLMGWYDMEITLTEEDYRSMLIRAGVNSGLTMPPQALQLMAQGSTASLTDGLGMLGLKLEERKAPIEELVVDQMLKSPAEN